MQTLSGSWHSACWCCCSRARTRQKHCERGPQRRQWAMHNQARVSGAQAPAGAEAPTVQDMAAGRRTALEHHAAVGEDDGPARRLPCRGRQRDGACAAPARRAQRARAQALQVETQFACLAARCLCPLPELMQLQMQQQQQQQRGRLYKCTAPGLRLCVARRAERRPAGTPRQSGTVVAHHG